jgi:hypothetical protein
MHRLALCAIAAAAAAIPLVVPAIAPATAAIQRCAATDLRGTMASSNGSGAGTLEVRVVVRNATAHACRLHGYPGLGLADGDGHVIPGFAVFDRAHGTPRTVILTPGRRAAAIIRYTDVPSGGETSCRAARFLIVTPPDTRSSLRVPARIAPCAHGRMLVQPLRIVPA